MYTNNSSYYNQSSFIFHTPPSFVLCNNLLFHRLLSIETPDGYSSEFFCDNLQITGSKSRKSVSTYCSLSFNNPTNTFLINIKPFSQFDLAVYNSVTTICRFAPCYPVFFNSKIICRVMNGVSNGSDPAKSLIDAVERSLDKLRLIQADIFCQEESILYNSSVSNLHGLILNITDCTTVLNGIKCNGYLLNEPPLLYEYAQISSHIVEIPCNYLYARHITPEGNPSTPLQCNPEKTAIKHFLLSRIIDMCRAHKLSRKITLNALFSTTSSICSTDLQSKDKRRILKHTEDTLKYFMYIGLIQGYSIDPVNSISPCIIIDSPSFPTA